MENQPTEPLPNALVVDDEKEVADAYALRLHGLCNVETVYDGYAALSAVEDGDIDIVLLDRHMPEISGDDVLMELNDRDYYGRIIMVTAIDPDFGVLEMPFDDYLCKPVDREDVRAAVSQQCTILGYETLGEYFELEAKCRVIEAQVPAGEREEHEEYQTAKDRVQRLAERADRLVDDRDELVETFESVDR